MTNINTETNRLELAKAVQYTANSKVINVGGLITNNLGTFYRSAVSHDGSFTIPKELEEVIVLYDENEIYQNYQSPEPTRSYNPLANTVLLTSKSILQEWNNSPEFWVYPYYNSVEQQPFNRQISPNIVRGTSSKRLSSQSEVQSVRSDEALNIYRRNVINGLFSNGYFTELKFFIEKFNDNDTIYRGDRHRLRAVQHKYVIPGIFNQAMLDGYADQLEDTRLSLINRGDSHLINVDEMKREMIDKAPCLRNITSAQVYKDLNAGLSV
jgi:hypothetical protein